jgi:monothiol glutaredoxin
MLTEAVKKEIEQIIQSDQVVLFMKGRRRMPQCGFSARVVSLLDELLSDYTTINVLDRPEIREGIKLYANWPTIPQLYVRGQFVGGCDIVGQLFEQGELASMIGVQVDAVAPPRVHIAPAALAEIRQAMAEEGGAALRVEVDANFRTSLGFADPQPSDVRAECEDLPVVLSRASAARADGLSIQFVPGPNGGFRIENPNEPPQVKQISPADLKARIDRGEAIRIVDVRTRSEWETARVPESERLDEVDFERLDRDAPIAFLCHHGQRSHARAEEYVSEGFKRVYNVEGGIDAWSRTVDPSVPRY